MIKKRVRISNQALKYFFIVAAIPSKLLVSQSSMEASRHQSFFVCTCPTDMIQFTETLVLHLEKNNIVVGEE